MLRPTISALELPPADPKSELAEETETYRSKVESWLAEGKEGQFVLLKGSELIGFWNDRIEAMSEGYERWLLCPFLVKQILSREPVLRGTLFRQCRSLIAGTNQTEQHCQPGS